VVLGKVDTPRRRGGEKKEEYPKGKEKKRHGKDPALSLTQAYPQREGADNHSPLETRCGV